MKKRCIALLTPLIPLLLADGCRRRDDAALEELPQDIAVNLKRLPGTDLLVSTRPPTPPSPGEAAPGPLPAPKACTTTQEFFSYVLFPVTICSSSPPFDDVVTAYQSAVTPSTASPGGEVKTFKLSSFAGGNVSPFLVCRRRTGPWGATIVKTVDCRDVTTCTMGLHCLGCPPFQWHGENCQSEGRPTEVIFIPELTERPIQSRRCPGSLSQCGDESPSPAPPPA